MANINTELEQIRKAVYGREVRGSIANAIELINKEQISTSTAQTNLDGKFNQLVINAGNSNAEVVASRVKADGTQFDTLSKRLDKGDELHNTLNNEVVAARTDSKNVVHKNLKARLDNFDSQMDNNIREMKIIQDTKRRVMVSFEVDDGWPQDLTVLKPIFQRYKIPLTCALITSNLNNVEERIRLQDEEGWEFASHTHNHLDLTTLSEKEIEYELSHSLSVLKQNGFKVNNITYPQGKSNEVVERIAKKYYKHGCRYQEGINYDVINSFRILRYPMGSYYANSSHNTLEFYKEKVDEAITNNAWLIFGLHSYADEFDSTQQQYLKDTIEYIKSKNIEIVTIGKGYEVFGNAVEVGDLRYYQGINIAFDGSSNIPIVRLEDHKYKASDDVTLYPRNKISIAQIGNYQNAGFPENTGGILETYRTTDFSFQIFYPVSSNNIYKRIYVGRSWKPFESVQKTTILSGVTNETLISSFERNKFTFSYIGNYDNAGLPEGKGGILTTFRHNTDDTFSYQTFNSLNTGNSYRRMWKSTAWGEWVITTSKQSRVAFDLTMSTNFQKTDTYINKYICIDKFISISGAQPNLTKELWSISEISTDSTTPTVLGTCGSGRDIQAYISTIDKALYIKYSTVGNNYPAFFEMSFC